MGYLRLFDQKQQKFQIVSTIFFAGPTKNPRSFSWTYKFFFAPTTYFSKPTKNPRNFFLDPRVILWDPRKPTKFLSRLTRFFLGRTSFFFKSTKAAKFSPHKISSFDVCSMRRNLKRKKINKEKQQIILDTYSYTNQHIHFFS